VIIPQGRGFLPQVLF